MRVQQYSIAHCHPCAHVQAATTDGVVVTGDMAMHAFGSLLACRLVAFCQNGRILVYPNFSTLFCNSMHIQHT